MAPDVAKKSTKLCKKYAYTEHSKYRQWEKDRRDRFNEKLEELSQSMPGYNKDNPWKKIEILEQAVANIASKKLGISKAHEESINKLAMEIQQLKSIILRFTDFKQNKKDIFKMCSKEINQVLEELQERDKENQAPEQHHQLSAKETEDCLAFVAKIAQTNDHSYSLHTEETPSLEVDSEEVVETVVLDQVEDVRPVTPQQPILMDLVAELDPQPLPAFISFETPPPSSNVNLPQIINLQDLSWPGTRINNGTNVTTIFVNKGSRASLLPSEQSTNTNTINKLPIPRLKHVKRTVRPKPIKSRTSKKKVKKTAEEKVDEVANIVLKPEAPVVSLAPIEPSTSVTSVTTVTTGTSIQAIPPVPTVTPVAPVTTLPPTPPVPTVPSVPSVPPELPVLPVIPVAPVLPVTQVPPPPSAPPVSPITDESTVAVINESLNALENVADSLPIDKKDVIDLQNNEEMEILEETIKEQGERETREKSEKNAKKEDKKESSSEKVTENNMILKKKIDQGKKKSKSSYSIAALCQISVNIGDRPDMANSPGVLSLNSVGTMSPTHTPAPTPTPDTVKSFGLETCSIVIEREENVLEELRTIRPEDVSNFENSTTETELKKNVTPSQTFLSEFPAVTKHSVVVEQDDGISVSTKGIQRDIYQALKDLGKELNLDSEALTVEQSESSKTTEGKKTQDVTSKASKDSAIGHSATSSVVSRYLPTYTSPSAMPSTSSSLSVYDFSASKPETPPIPLQKSRKPDVRREEVRNTGYKSPEKKIYTEMQSKPKKSPVEPGKTKEGILSSSQHTQEYPQTMEYHQHAQGKVQYHQPPSSYQSRHQVYMAPHYPPYQTMAPLQQHPQHPAYHHAPHHPYPPTPEADMKAQAASHHSRYSCSSHSYLPAPNYHHYPPAPKHYPGQGQPAWGPHHNAQNYPKPRDRGIHGSHMEMEVPTVGSSQLQGATFTVNQLVNSSQRKGGTKRSSTVGKAGVPSKAARGEAKEKEKEDCRKRSGGGNRRNKSGGRSTSYSAESLMMPSSTGLVVTADSKEESKLKLGPSPAKKEGKLVDGQTSSSRTQATNSWSNVDHFGGLQFSSLSPSPASLFPPDLSSLDFPMAMFGPGEGKDYNLQTSQPSSSHKTPSKQQTTASCQRPAVSSVSDWSLNSAILDTGFLPPLPTLTPPGDPMGDPMASYNFMSPMSHGHTGFYSCSASQGVRPQGQPHSYSAHSAANIPISGYASSPMVMSKPGSSQSFPPSQAQTGSLVNFNLSTIFPEINIPAVVHSAPNCQVKPTLPPLPPHPGSALEFLPNSSHRPSQLATPDLLPHHSLASLHLHHSSSFSSSQVHLPPGLPQHMVPGITFPNIPE